MNKKNSNQLPNEIFQQIFLNLSQSYRARYSVICKKWYDILRTPIFYHTIHIHNVKQAKRFIEFASMVKIQDQYASQYVRKFVISVTLLTYGAYVNKTFVLVLLQKICPFVTEFDYTYINKSELVPDKTPFYWTQLTQFPLGYTKVEKRCLQYIDPKTTKLLELELTKWNEVIEVDSESSPLPSSSPPFIQLIVHKRVQTLSRKNVNDTYPYHYPLKVKTFTSRILIFPTLTQLNELYLDFNLYNKTRPLARYELNESTLESLSQSCPSLQKLTLVHFYMNLSSDYHTSVYTPHHSMTSLHFTSCLFYESSCYHYISLKYPHVTTLIFTSLKGLPIQEDRQAMEEYRSAIYHMLVHYKQLNSLKINVMTGTNLKWSPWKNLMDWIIQKPQPFSELELPCEWFSLEIDRYQCHHSILNHITTLTLELPSSFECILSDILGEKNSMKKKERQYVSTSITSLKVSHKGYESVMPFYFYQWLYAFPRLHTLSLSNLVIKDIDYSQVIDQDSLHRIIQQHEQQLKKMGPFYSLKKLTILYSKLWLGKNGLSTLCQQCPSLNYLHFSDLNLDLPTWDEEKKAIRMDFYMDASHLNLDYLYIRHFYYKPILSKDMRLLDGRDIIYIGYVNIHELSTDLKWGYNFSRVQLRYNRATFVNEKPFTLHITCQSLDRLNIQVYRM